MRALVGVVVLLGGCSVALVQGPPEPPTPPFECTDSHAPPNIDLGIAGALTVVGLLGLTAQGHTCDVSQPDCVPNNLGVDFAHELGAASVLTALVFVLSAWHGYSETDACRDAPSASPVARAPS